LSDFFNIGFGNNDFSIRERSNSDFISFWAEEAKKLFWFSPWNKTLQWSPPFAKWFEGGLINASYNALDVHQKNKGQKPAIIWEAESGESRVLTYRDLWIQVKKFANALKSLGITKGDRVTIYLPMVPELVISMLACARIGVPHIVVFSGFSSTSLRERIEDSKSKIVITSDGINCGVI
jgi:acetyl-CoA synthetase